MGTMGILTYVKNTVVRGRGEGKKLGCPTANVNDAEKLDLPTGIYCGLAQLVIREPNEIQASDEPGSKEIHDQIVKNLPYISPVQGMVCSYGYNPFYANQERSLEVHLLDSYNFNFYGAELRVLICKRMRDEQNYSNKDELIEAIANDIRTAKSEVVNYKQHMQSPDYFFMDTNNNTSNQNNGQS